MKRLSIQKTAVSDEPNVTLDRFEVEEKEPWSDDLPVSGYFKVDGKKDDWFSLALYETSPGVLGDHDAKEDSSLAEALMDYMGTEDYWDVDDIVNTSERIMQQEWKKNHEKYRK